MAEQQAQRPADRANTRPAAGGNRRPGGRGRGNDRRRQVNEKADQFEETVIGIDRVARVVKGGRRFRFKALVAVGDKKTMVGVGVAKGADVQSAIAKAGNVARKNMIKVPVVNETIPHEIETKVAGARILIKPAAQGTGVIAGSVIRSVIDLTGIKNLLSKSLGSSNKVNVAYATIEALKQMVPKEDWISNVNQPKKAVAKKPAAKEAK